MFKQVSSWKKRFLTIGLVGSVLMQITVPASACTLFAANGTKFVAGGGTLVAKNRDWRPAKQMARLVTPTNGNKYYGLFAGKDYKFNAAGINEKGLMVAMSTAGSIPKKERLSYKRFKSQEGLRTNEYLLRYYNSVDEVLKTKEPLWQEPVNFILADKKMIAYVEVGPQGKIAVRKVKNGTAYHTNHYVEKAMLPYNQKIGKSSATRYERIKMLMTEQKLPFTLERFVEISQDKNAGANNSIYRVGNKPNSSQTLANFIAYIPPKGYPQLWLKYRKNPEDKGREVIEKVNLEELFK